MWSLFQCVCQPDFCLVHLCSLRVCAFVLRNVHLFCPCIWMKMISCDGCYWPNNCDKDTTLTLEWGQWLCSCAASALFWQGGWMEGRGRGKMGSGNERGTGRKDEMKEGEWGCEWSNLWIERWRQGGSADGCTVQMDGRNGGGEKVDGIGGWTNKREDEVVQYVRCHLSICFKSFT